MNRLAGARSPYLLQHADNPVDWFPWGDEAFAKARDENKPIFLSIGYSTCHWCHVMAHESFEDETVAGVLNDAFVSIKVDREERPDVDRVYMAFVQATTGSGGWPMSVWLTPDLKPFFGGTYFPPTSRWGRPGFVEMLREIARVWRSERDRVIESADAVTEQLRAMDGQAPDARMPGAAALVRTVGQFAGTFDRRQGGFGGAPKFPRPSELLFLLREQARAARSDAGPAGEPGPADMVLRTLRAMALGGIRDHVGGGFHRYSVDAAWRVPHFEKMLYDQAQLVLAYLEGAQVSGDPFYAEVAEDTLQYVAREMTGPDGGFYSAEDADSVSVEQAGMPRPHKTEGAFYLWRASEIDERCGSDAEVVRLRFGIEPDGNAPIDPQQEFTGRNLLYVARSVEQVASATGRTADAVVDALSRARMALFAARLERPRPHLDDKVLTAWNGLMIGAFARGARVLGALGSGGAAHLATARRAARFLHDRMWQADGRRLLRRYRDGDADIDAFAEDYACLIFGLLELFQADGDPSWIEWAIALQRRQDELFWDEARGGWFSTTGRDASVLIRMKEEYDGAEPTASSMSVLNLLWLTHLVSDPDWAERLDRTLRLFGDRIETMGRAVPMMAAALSTRLAGVVQIVVALPDAGDPAGSGLLHEIARRYLPFAIAFQTTDRTRPAVSRVLPFAESMAPVDGRAAAYVCREFACQRPVTTVLDLDRLL
jgi:uncharacterized protein YyaL (SSP411 family)